MSIYVPPATNAVDFALTTFTPADLTPAEMALAAHTVPALNAVDFALVAYTPPTIPYVGWELLPGVGPVNYTLACNAGAYAYTGNAATLTVLRKLALEAGAYSYVGNDATLDYVPGVAKIDYVLSCDAGAYSIVGSDAVLDYVSGAPLIPSGGGGGGGYRYPNTYWERRKTGQDYSGAAINEILEKAASDVYAELAKKKEIQAQVVEIIRPFTDSDAKKPQVASIDWYAVERDVKATQALLQLWSDQVAGMQEEEDMFAILLLES